MAAWAFTWNEEWKVFFSTADGAHKGNVWWYAEGERALSVVIIEYLGNKGIVPGNSGSEVCHTMS